MGLYCRTTIVLTIVLRPFFYLGESKRFVVEVRLWPRTAKKSMTCDTFSIFHPKIAEIYRVRR